MSKAEDINDLMINIELDKIESLQNGFDCFYTNFINLLQNILEHGCTESGYKEDSPIFNTEQIRMQNFKEICVKNLFCVFISTVNENQWKLYEENR